MLKAVWCWIFHYKYRARTGVRVIYTHSIDYHGRCSKCGNEYDEFERLTVKHGG